MVTLTINKQQVEVAPDTSVLLAAKKLGIQIPTLCYNEHLSVHGGCRMCMVEQYGLNRLVPACSTIVTPGMEIDTESPSTISARRFIISLLLSRAKESPEIRAMAERVGVSPDGENESAVTNYLLRRSPQRQPTNCILCSLCVRACAEIPERFAISVSERGMKRHVSTPFNKISEACIGCTSCVYVCPTNAITIESAD